MIDKIGLSYGAYNSSSQTAWNNQSEEKEKSKITYRLVKTGNDTCELLTLVNGKVVKADSISMQEAYEKYGKGSKMPDLKISFDFNQAIANSMESKSSEEAKIKYGPQVANNFFAQA